MAKSKTIQDSFSSLEVVAGVGNPGVAFRHTYHNAGIVILKELARRAGNVKFTTHSSGTFAYMRAGSLVLVESLLMMNESGRAIASALRFVRRKPRELLLLHDDSDIAVGEAKFSFGRGSAGHRGVRSVIASLGTKDFWRFRIGIRKGKGKAGEFVLRPIAPYDRKKIYSVFPQLTTKLKEKLTFLSGVGLI